MKSWIDIDGGMGVGVGIKRERQCPQALKPELTHADYAKGLILEIFNMV